MIGQKRHSPDFPLPARWPKKVKSAALWAISLAQFAVIHTRGWAASSVNARVRLKAENERLRQEIALLREEIRIKDARMATIPSQRRPRYPPHQRMAVLELKTARGWSLEQAARAFLVTAATIASWMKRLDEEGPEALVQLPEPVNKLPQFVGHVVRRLKTLCPSMGKVKIAQSLARAGLHLGTTSVGRMLKGGGGTPASRPDKDTDPSPEETQGKSRIVRTKRPNHVWHTDLTVVPTAAGFCCSWVPFALPQRWPFCFWVAVAVDHFSRRVMGCAAFKEQPDSETVRNFLGRAIAKARHNSPRPLAGEGQRRSRRVRVLGTMRGSPIPKYIICDRGPQFDCGGFRNWCRWKGIKPPRYGAVGKHGSIAVVERFILTMKSLLSCLLLIPLRREAFQRELDLIVAWYNAHRPHTWLGGRTPDEAYYRRFPANRRPRFEPRSRWPRSSPCAKPWALVRGSPGAKVELEVRFHRGHRHLPVVNLRRGA